MHGHEMREGDTNASSLMIEHILNGSCHEGCRMDEGAILIAGVGGIGCTWAERAHTKCSELADLLLIDADELHSLEPQQHTACTSMQAATAGELPLFLRWQLTASGTALTLYLPYLSGLSS